MELAKKYIIGQYIDYGDLNDNAEKQIETAFIDGFNAALKFAEWAAFNYIRLNNVWVHRYVNQMDKKNWITTERLFEIYSKIKTV